ncbi:ABC transporter ATP-binding protein [Brevibacterium sp. 91QC2O2]|uniref:ABC transporter ATP-binding protein n=1 Tax=Brevibacterium sp. 91QC2O2 TaxID=2968458 RepID=UPI00211CD3BE|nr:ABC transporter ATP-binding protein [Brevibacterium sp. 91QC2O2]MCQ9368748.1 ABC transporter ATP-binding protein [Brevibacterium sp. 91QC2O2]
MTTTPTGGSTTLLSVRDLTVSFGKPGREKKAVRSISFDVRRGETLAIVGESGSGKSMTSLASIGLLPDTANVTGSVSLVGTEVVGASDQVMRKLRGSKVSMVFQDPLSTLNPVLTVGHQITEAILIHRPMGKEKAKQEAIELLDVVGIPEPQNRMDSYPHEFSGGMRQRVVIAIALANKPDLIIADEPTTALDVTVQNQVLHALDAARRHVNAGMILVTHDLGVIAGHADRVAVMYGGRILETGGINEFFESPKTSYARGLLRAIPRIDKRSERLLPIPRQVTKQLDDVLDDDNFDALELPGIEETPSSDSGTQPPSSRQVSDDIVLEVENVIKDYSVSSKKHFRKQSHRALNDVSFTLRNGETLGIVGESGSGKSTLSRAIVGLHDVTSGSIRLNGSDISEGSRSTRKKYRRKVQMVFQDPYSSMDPRMSVEEVLTEAMRLGRVSKQGWSDRVDELLTSVGLSPDMADRYPHEFSGGQRQRIAIARALATDPEVIVLDEPVSALDVSVQAAVINLLEDLRDERGLTYIFVTHDLSVVAHISDRIAVMKSGEVVEIGETSQVINEPSHSYTKQLVSAAPIPDPKIERPKRNPDGAI